MPLDTAIQNVGEYYSSHYLDSTFAKDTKELQKRWNERKSEAPPRRLQGLAQAYFRVKGQVVEEPVPERRWQLSEEQASWHGRLLEALGYGDRQPMDLPVEGDKAYVPALGRLNRYGKPWLIICESVFCIAEGNLREGMPSEDPLAMRPVRDQLTDEDAQLVTGDWARAAGRLFTEEDSPRWILFLGGSRLILLDRNTYAQGRWLAFDLDDAFGRGEKATFDQIAAFISAETLCPDSESDEVLHDRLEEQSHKLAHGVTEGLQSAVREAIELLANEWVADRRRRGLPMTKLRPDEALPDGTTDVTAEQLRIEALNFVYRVIFCLYAEAHGAELEILPISEDTYRLGYSLEALRDLEQVPLTETSASGTYMHEHLKRLFSIIHDGFHPSEAAGDGLLEYSGERVRTFTVRPLTATLFSLIATPLLSRARLTNHCIQQVIRRLSLSIDERSKTIGRVNYAELGVNQLGAVYEGLLSWTGMFAEQDLIQVKRAKDKWGSTKTATWFVSVDCLEEFKTDEVERLENGKPRIYTKGTFILHLSGIDRETSASYYTPEVLTKCLVEETLRERLKDFGSDDADKILELTICEPAMGSGAFLNEVARQLAERYLELKQEQIGETIEPSRYRDELQRVRHYITTRNCYGVDLNPVAVELGALSLWLGCMHRLRVGDDNDCERFVRGATPWFGLRLRCGNSLIGARRAVWTSEQLEHGKHGGKENESPRLLRPGEERAHNEIYHFLVFDEEMVPMHRDKLIRQFWPDPCDVAKKWVAKHVKAKWKLEEIRDALTICDLIDRHWHQYATERQEALDETACAASVWPAQASDEAAHLAGPSLQRQETVRATLEASSGSFRRLQLVMDAWCALWFWPIDCVSDLPPREAFLASARLLLGAEPPDESTRTLISARLGFQIDALLAASGESVPDAKMLSEAVPWFGAAHGLSCEQMFHHWELAFVEMLGPSTPRSGFDLIVGNPPWILADWTDPQALSEIEPLLGVRSAKSAEFNRRRLELLTASDARDFYVTKFRASVGSSTYLSSPRLYSLLSGVRPNLYKNFLVRSWDLLGAVGIAGLLHPEGTYDDSRGGTLREAYYRRLRAHYQFTNELLLFLDVDHHTKYSVNISSARAGEVRFVNIANLFHPKTIGQCRTHDHPDAPVPGIKTDEGKWEIRPHRQREVVVTEVELQLFAKLLEDEGENALRARLPQVHATQIVEVIRRVAGYPTRLADLDSEYYATQMLNEVGAQRDGSITRQEDPSYQPASPDDWVLSGPHFFVGTPLNKSPRTACTHNNAYDDIDLNEIEDDYLPRAVYRPGDESGALDTYHAKIPRWPRPSLPGFWPIMPEEESAWELVFGERPRVHCSSRGRFVYIDVCSGDVDDAVRWLTDDVHADERETWRQRFPLVSAAQGKPEPAELADLLNPITTRFRYANRRGLSLGTERSLITAIIPKGPSHIDGVFSLTFRESHRMVAFAATTASICCDFLIRITGKSDCRHDILCRQPVMEGKIIDPLIARGLRLNCISSIYAELWNELARKHVCDESWTTEDARLCHDCELPWKDLDLANWSSKTPLRSDFARRQALLEIDVLVALGLGLSLEELIALYRVQFPVMRTYERADEYDARGRRMPNTTRKDQGGTQSRAARQEWEHAGNDGRDRSAPPLVVTWPIDDGKKSVTKTFYPPFGSVDREDDCARAYSVFCDRYRGGY